MRQFVSLAKLAILLVLLAACTTSPEQRIDEEKVAEANANIGIDYMRKGQYDLALNSLHKALRFNSDHVNANWALGITYDRLKEPVEAQRFYSRAAQLQPRPDILNYYGVFLCQQGQTAEAVSNFERAAANPRYAAPEDALANAGFCLQQSKRADEAEVYFRKALERNPKQQTALLQMATLNYNEARYFPARAFIQRLDAASTLNNESLLLGARIELALNEREAALGYLRRYNSGNPGAETTLQELQELQRQAR